MLVSAVYGILFAMLKIAMLMVFVVTAFLVG
jgi:hypothetical protein